MSKNNIINHVCKDRQNGYLVVETSAYGINTSNGLFKKNI